MTAVAAGLIGADLRGSRDPRSPIAERRSDRIRPIRSSFGAKSCASWAARACPSTTSRVEVRCPQDSHARRLLIDFEVCRESRTRPRVPRHLRWGHGIGVSMARVGSFVFMDGVPCNGEINPQKNLPGSPRIGKAVSMGSRGKNVNADLVARIALAGGYHLARNGGTPETVADYLTRRYRKRLGRDVRPEWVRQNVPGFGERTDPRDDDPTMMDREVYEQIRAEKSRPLDPERPGRRKEEIAAARRAILSRLQEEGARGVVSQNSSGDHWNFTMVDKKDGRVDALGVAAVVFVLALFSCAVLFWSATS